MMPALKIHSNREYIDSFVIELSLSFLCHNSHGSLSRLMYYQKHATPVPLCPSGTHSLSPLLSLTTTLFFICYPSLPGSHMTMQPQKRNFLFFSK